MIVNISQMTLVSQILASVISQATNLRIEKPCVSSRQLNAIIKAATDITMAMQTEDVLATPNMGVIRWLASDDTGLSSKCMALVLCGMGDGKTDHPHDADDFGRCHRFLLTVPGIRENDEWKSKMSEVSPMWKRLIEGWDDLTALYVAERSAECTQRIYAIAASLRRERAASVGA